MQQLKLVNILVQTMKENRKTVSIQKNTSQIFMLLNQFPNHRPSTRSLSQNQIKGKLKMKKNSDIQPKRRYATQMNQKHQLNKKKSVRLKTAVYSFYKDKLKEKRTMMNEEQKLKKKKKPCSYIGLQKSKTSTIPTEPTWQIEEISQANNQRKGKQKIIEQNKKLAQIIERQCLRIKKLEQLIEGL